MEDEGGGDGEQEEHGGAADEMQDGKTTGYPVICVCAFV